jgi:predicted alpha/beta hydrolase family esterase
MRTLILPGLHNSEPGHWQSRWEARDETLLRVIQDEWETPHCADWIARLDEALALAESDTVLVAHSAGCALVAHWAVGESSRCVRGALLVAPSDPEAPSFPSGPAGFAPIPMLRFRFRSIVVASANDPYVTLARAQTFAVAWGSEFVTIGEAGHINSASGLGDWAQGLALLNILRKTAVEDLSGIVRGKRIPGERSDGSAARSYSRGASGRNNSGVYVVATNEREASTNTKNRSPQKQQPSQAHVLAHFVGQENFKNLDKNQQRHE